MSMSGLTDGVRMLDKLLDCLNEASGMNSACLILDTPDGLKVKAAVGQLAAQLQGLSLDEIEALSSLVGDIRSCYTAGDTLGRGFVGTDSLRNGGARAVVVVPLWIRRQRLGTLIFAHSRPLRLTGADVEPLEMLADTVAAMLLDYSGSPEWLRSEPTLARAELRTNGDALSARTG